MIFLLGHCVARNGSAERSATAEIVVYSVLTAGVFGFMIATALGIV